MNFHQLQYAVAIARHGLSVTQAASALGTSQPAISRALKALERELGFDLFVREGRAFARVTPQGTRVLEYATRALAEIESLKAVAADLNQDNRGTLAIATTHTQARYVLPPVVQAFRERYPEVELHLHQGTSEQIAEMVATDRVQLAIATGSDGLFPGLVLLPVYRWHRQVIVPRHHPLANEQKLTLQELAKYPLVTYVFSFSGASSLHTVFAREHLTPSVALTARDSDVIKTYVRLGLGVGIVASVAIEPQHDADLVVIEASHLFPIHTTWIGFRRGTLLRNFAYEFMQLFGPHLTRRLIDRAIEARDGDGQAELFRKISLPTR
ncbi:MAG TPA: LysR substrate-binding domain-containing protein [Steroidobacteraceae bacterium]|jgi:LysR family transcriptional regulator, cys regulon transcriptional activator|nr:LysR substrate-binding domain-containing protein [Steroidobacteraceae bacterium]HMI36097.1 LysR substrate-binding domain-containing protein [Steroidobacteraceae bacterium]